MLNPFKLLLKRKKILGIDIGTASIKVVELSGSGKRKALENYGEIKSEFISPNIPDEKASYGAFSVNTLANAIKTILQESKIKTKEVIFSVPDFSTFCTAFDIPPMPKEEIAGAIAYNASQYITVPIADVTLDWQVIPSANSGTLSKVFLVAIPNQVVKDYKMIAELAGLQLHALEAEVFGIARALVKDRTKTVCLVDIGVETSTINIIDRGFLKLSYSVGFSSKQLTNSLSLSLGLGYNEIEAMKNNEGFNSSKKELVESLTLAIEPMASEINTVCTEFLKKEKKEVGEIYITGGAANLPGLKDFFTKNLQKNTSIPNCFSGISYPSSLAKTLAQMSPSFSAAVGVALGRLEG